VAFTYLKFKSAKCLCLLPVVLVLLFWSWSWSCKQRSWSYYFGLGLKNVVFFTSLGALGPDPLGREACLTPKSRPSPTTDTTVNLVILGQTVGAISRRYKFDLSLLAFQCHSRSPEPTQICRPTITFYRCSIVTIHVGLSLDSYRFRDNR